MDGFPNMNDENINISDVLAAIETTDPSFAERNLVDVEMISESAGCGGRMSTRSRAAAVAATAATQNIDRPTTGAGAGNMPYVDIVEQPASKALRFRYECEGRSAGSIPGVNSTPENKTFPSIRIVGFKGRAIVVVSCVTKDQPYRPHPHNLVGKEVCRKGVCTVEVSSDNMTVSFDKLGIQCVKKKDIEEALRLREEIRVDPFKTGFDHKRQPTSIDLNSVRLCFQVFLEGQEKGKFTVPLQPIVSEPIYDKKAMSDLVICKLSHCSASVAGGTEMVLLCEKVAKEDIQVRFFEVRDGQTYWEGFGDFQPTHVHKQVAIAFRTPSYRHQQVEQPVQAYIQLRRPSDGAMSEPLHFQLLPLGLGRPGQHLWSLRRAFFARKKAASAGESYDLSATLNRVSALCEGQHPVAIARPQLFDDEFNNNNNSASFEEMLSAKRAYSKLSALRALNDIHNVQKSASFKNQSQIIQRSTGLSPVRESENNDIGQNDDEETIVPEKSIITIEELEENHGNEQRRPGVSKDGKDKTDWFDYTEVGKWVQKTQEAKESTEENDAEPLMVDPNTITNGDKCLDELLTEVAELDKIYDDTHVKILREQQLQQEAAEKNGNGEPTVQEMDVRDNQTYTSLQMAMKNPVWVRVVRKPCEPVPPGATTLPSPMIAINPDTPPPRPPPPATRINKRDVIATLEEEEPPLPPLPPKRIRKTPSMPVLPHAVSNQTLAPKKNLPAAPTNSLPKQSKPGIFSKLFSKRSKKDGKERMATAMSSTTSLPGLGSNNNNEKIGSQELIAKMPAIRALQGKSLEGDLTPPYGADLTEAEHYALYTAMAPRATASEFDEMSFYYSPVEGGRIMEVKETA